MICGLIWFDVATFVAKCVTAYLRSDNVQTILVENASRFARDHIVQGLGHRLLQKEGIDLIPVDAPEYFTEDTPTANLIRQILGVISEFDKAVTVQRLKSARDRKSEKIARRVEGRKGYGITHPDLVKEAKRLRRKNPITGRRRSLRKIADELAVAGYTRPDGLPFNAQTIKNMIA